MRADSLIIIKLWCHGWLSVDYNLSAEYGRET